jgi:predicted neuraminidase
MGESWKVFYNVHQEWIKDTKTQSQKYKTQIFPSEDNGMSWREEFQIQAPNGLSYPSLTKVLRKQINKLNSYL